MPRTVRARNPNDQREACRPVAQFARAFGRKVQGRQIGGRHSDGRTPLAHLQCPCEGFGDFLIIFVFFRKWRPSKGKPFAQLKPSI